MSSFEAAKGKIISSALGKALGMTASTLLADVATKIAAVIDRSSTIQTATTSTTDQNASCFRVNGTNVEVIPAKGLWNSWDWAKSCIRVTAASLGITAAKIVKGNTILGIAGTDAGYNAGVSAGRNSPAFLMSVFEVAAKANTTYYVPSGNYNAANNISIENNTAKIQLTGIYKIICAAIWTGTGSQNMYAQLYRNGSKIADVAINLLTGLTGWYNNNISLFAGDTIQVRTGKTGGSSEIIIVLLIEKVG